MTVNQLIDACTDSINHPERSLYREPVVAFTSRGGSPLSKKLFPKFKFMVNQKNGSVYYYSAKEMLRAIARNNMIELDDYAAARKLGIEVKDEGTNEVVPNAA